MQPSRVRSFEQLLTGKSVESPICRAPSGTFVSTHYHVTRHLIKLGIMSVCCCCCYRLIESKYFEGWSKSAVLNSLIFWANLILSRGTIMLSAMMIQFRGNFVLPASPIVSILRNSTGRNVTQQVSNTLVAPTSKWSWGCCAPRTVQTDPWRMTAIALDRILRHQQAIRRPDRLK